MTKKSNGFWTEMAWLFLGLSPLIGLLIAYGIVSIFH
jgi:hypothetical protein